MEWVPTYSEIELCRLWERISLLTRGPTVLFISLTLDSYCVLAAVILFDSQRENGQCPWLNRQVVHGFKFWLCSSWKSRLLRQLLQALRDNAPSDAST